MQLKIEKHPVNTTKLEVRGKERVVTEDSLAKRKQQIMKDLLIPLKTYGSVVLRANKERLVQAVEDLKADVTMLQEGIKKNLQKNMDENAMSLVEALLPAVLARPPDSYKKILGPDLTPAQIRHYLERYPGCIRQGRRTCSHRHEARLLSIPRSCASAIAPWP